MREDVIAAPFFEALADDAFAVQRCGACDRAFLPPAPVCPHCHAPDVDWERTDARGRLYAFTELLRTPPNFDEPAVVGTVVVEGVRVLAPIDAPYDALSIGDPVALVPTDGAGDHDRGRWADAPFFTAEPRPDAE